MPCKFIFVLVYLTHNPLSFCCDHGVSRSAIAHEMQSYPARWKTTLLRKTALCNIITIRFFMTFTFWLCINHDVTESSTRSTFSLATQNFMSFWKLQLDHHSLTLFLCILTDVYDLPYWEVSITLDIFFRLRIQDQKFWNKNFSDGITILERI